ncbi:SLC6A6 [Acanthosepion pharaonis]|uniref:SLC6A6 n=1 Tax=Acanthosepion pharaonis TaxID=158019 RepID=A0A812D0M2_ACAPH|nr:SLC6A6 [Sepia pharaonis]
MGADNRGSSFATLGQLLGTGLLVPFISFLPLSAPFLPGQFLLKCPAPHHRTSTSCFYWGHPAPYFSTGVPLSFPDRLFFSRRGTNSGLVSSVIAGPAYHPVQSQSGLIKSVPYIPFLPVGVGLPIFFLRVLTGFYVHYSIPGAFFCTLPTPESLGPLVSFVSYPFPDPLALFSYLQGLRQPTGPTLKDSPPHVIIMDGVHKSVR